MRGSRGDRVWRRTDSVVLVECQGETDQQDVPAAPREPQSQASRRAAPYRRRRGRSRFRAAPQRDGQRDQGAAAPAQNGATRPASPEAANGARRSAGRPVARRSRERGSHRQDEPHQETPETVALQSQQEDQRPRESATRCWANATKRSKQVARVRRRNAAQVNPRNDAAILGLRIWAERREHKEERCARC